MSDCKREGLHTILLKKADQVAALAIEVNSRTTYVTNEFSGAKNESNEGVGVVSTDNFPTDQGFYRKIYEILNIIERCLKDSEKELERII